jgi:tetratricopeptide (TPR) repeat protein
MIDTCTVKIHWLRLISVVCACIFGSMAAAGGKNLPQPTEAEQRFAQGLRLAAAHKTDEAIKIFSGLTADYPMLPQPYVQLAALYVQQGKLPRAIESLRTAIDHQLGDGTLQESLGDLYVELAKQSYREAGASDKYAALQKLGSRPMLKGPDQP